LLQLIRRVLHASLFAGEGHRKVRARLRREHGVQVSGKRVLRLLQGEGLLAPQRVRGRRKPRPHEGTIIPDRPNLRWGTDATMANELLVFEVDRHLLFNECVQLVTDPLVDHIRRLATMPGTAEGGAAHVSTADISR
jgi:hypothetical protein